MEVWWGHITDRAGGGKAREETVEDRKTTNLPPVRVRDPNTQLNRGRYQ